MINRRQMLASVAGLSAASFLPSSLRASPAEGVLNVALANNWEGIDPFFDSTRQGIILTRQVYDHFLIADPETYELKPLLATGYSWADDLTLEFDLREDVLFHNGDPLTADDVVATFKFGLDPNSKITRSVFDWMKDVEKIGEHKVRFHYNYVYPTSLQYFATQLSVYSRRHLESASRAELINNPIGTGPFKVLEHNVGRSAVFERFAEYREDSPKASGNIERMVVRVIPERTTQVSELISGTLDWIWHVSPDVMEQLSAFPTIKTSSVETMRISGLFFDVTGRAGQSPVQDQRVRMAAMHAINRQAYRDYLIKGDSRVIDSFCFPSMFGCTEDVTVYEYDPQKAKSLLAEAGYEDGFEITMLTSSPRPEVEAIAADLAKVGIRVNASFLQYPAVRSAMTDGEAQMVMLNWGSFSINDVVGAAGYWFDGSGKDMARDAEVTAWLSAAANTVDESVRKENYKLALQRIAERVYFLPLSSYSSNVAQNAQLVVPIGVDECPAFYNARWT